MQPVHAWFMLVMSFGILAIAIQGVHRGWLPNGPKGYKQGEGVRRDSNPAGFWIVFAMYLGFGLYAMVFALRILFRQP
jgi:hypothetical protein